MQRRTFLTGTAAWVGMSWLAPAVLNASSNAPKFAANPFTLGVASGEPWEDSVVLWTRLAPDALNGGGMSAASVEVKWELASDEQMKIIVASGMAVAAAELGHAVHVEVFGLQPARWYWYRFMVGNEVSPIGRTRTAPAPGVLAERFNFAFASCQHYETGWYTAYKHMCEENLDLVVFLGDYIYEYGAIDGRVRKHNSPEIMGLNDYRNRYALYKGDALLQRAHAQFPWVVTWDDHEVANNYAGLHVPTQKTGVEMRRAAAYQAFFEHQPLRPSQLRQGPYMDSYRDLSFGRLIEMQVLDTRQFRTPQPCGDGTKEACAEVFDTQATILGRAQKRWLMRNLDRSSARWNVLAQQVMMTPLDMEPGPMRKFSMDKWSGYNVETKQLMQFLAARKPSNPIVLTGDIHSNWVTELKADFDKPESAVLGAEFTGTSISSAGDGMDTRPTTEKVIAENPHLKFYNGQRGYVRCAVTREKWQTDYRVVPFVTKPDAPVSTRASFVVENGRAGVKRA
jgi:alkaline phosphatase D